MVEKISLPLVFVLVTQKVATAIRLRVSMVASNLPIKRTGDLASKFL